jgi:hydrogenase expression/formation protein HypC
VIEINGLLAMVDVQGARREANLMLMPEDVAVGEYVLVHAGFAIQKVDEDAALDALRLIDEMIAELEAEGVEFEEEDPDSFQRAPSMPPIKLD